MNAYGPDLGFTVPDGVVLYVAEKTGQDGRYWSLDLIRVAEHSRRQGVGGRVMADLCAAADRAGVVVALTPGNDWGAPKAFLRRWYRSFGFVPNRGRGADLSISGAMIRRPQQHEQ